MKKNILLTFVLTIVMFATAQAQSQDYGISITLANGTTINLTADEVSNITFANGAVTVSGSTIEELVNSVAASDSTSTLRNDEQDQRISNLQAIATHLETEITNIQTSDASMQESINALINEIAALTARVAALEAK